MKEMGMIDFKLDKSIQVFHCGGRSGIHDSFKSYKGPMNYTSFEPSPDAISSLENVTYPNTNISFKVFPIALSEREQKIKINTYNQGDLNSIFEFDLESSNRYKYQLVNFESEIEVKATTIDGFATASSSFPDYLILDTQGSELAILSGAAATLRDSVVALRAEVEFFCLYKKQPLFGQVHEFLMEKGFKLARLETPGKGELGVSFDSGPFSMEKYDAAPAWADSIFILQEDELLKINCDTLFALKSLKWINFCILNSCVSQVYDLMMAMIKQKRLDVFFSHIDSNSASCLIAALLERLKMINNSPWQTQNDTSVLYKGIRDKFESVLKRYLKETS